MVRHENFDTMVIMLDHGGSEDHRTFSDHYVPNIAALSEIHTRHICVIPIMPRFH